MDVETQLRRFSTAPQVPDTPSGGLNLDLMYVSPVYFGMGRHFNLTPTESLLIAAIHSLSQNEERACYMSQENLGKALNVSLPTINGLLEKLRTEDELLQKGGKHSLWKTYRWRLSPKALDHLRYLQGEIKKRKSQKESEYKKS
jgi:hypothetical protein